MARWRRLVMAILAAGFVTGLGFMLVLIALFRGRLGTAIVGIELLVIGVWWMRSLTREER